MRVNITQSGVVHISDDVHIKDIQTVDIHPLGDLTFRCNQNYRSTQVVHTIHMSFETAEDVKNLIGRLEELHKEMVDYQS